MSGRLRMNTCKTPFNIKLKAWGQWVNILLTYSFGVLLTYFPMGIIVALTAKKQNMHPMGKPTQELHDTKYIEQGSSGSWEYWNSNASFVKGWNNLEDGTLREPSGKNSAACGGKEKTLWNQYLWLCRNPFNYAKRTNPKYFCPIDDCDIEYWGQYELSDKVSNLQGSQWVMATHKLSGRKYYGYRSVSVVSEDQVRHCRLGFKIEPSHALEYQDLDDKDKSITFRLPVKTTID